MEIRLEQLKKAYDGRNVLDIDRLVFPSGRITALIGPNGAGKTTLLHLTAGILDADSGRIRYDGNETIPWNRMTLGFQKPYLFNMTVESNISYPLRLRKWAPEKTEARVQELLLEMGLWEHRKKKAWKLSGGETQKVALARSLSFYPDLLLLDEPTANIDPYTVTELEHILRNVNKTLGTTILLVSHNLAQAKRISDHVVLMNRGKIVETGESTEFFRSPKEADTKKFLSQEILI